MARSTVGCDRRLLQAMDAWAARRGLPSGPGHRTRALEAIVRHVVRGEPLPEVLGD